MILWEIFKALDSNCAGLDSGTDCVYNIIQKKNNVRRTTNMEREIVFPERMKVCQNHPEKAEIFWLEQMLIKAGHPYHFNFWEDLRPTPFNHDGGDPEKDIDWDGYDFMIEIERIVDDELTRIDIRFSPDNKERLCISQPIPAEDCVRAYLGLSAEEVMEIIEKIFQGAK